jgi:hypothetical protein
MPRTRRDGRKMNYQSSRVRKMTEPEAAWVGAMIEAEGSVVFAPQVRVAVVNSDPEIISALLRATGSGTVQIRQPHLGTKLLYCWWMSKWREVQALVAQAGPYSMKLQKVEV